MRAVSFRAFRRDRRGSVAVETAISVSVLVIAFAGILQIVHAAWVSDRMDRAARAAVRTVALAPDANAASLPGLACAAIRKELGLGDGFDCGKKLSVTVERSLAPGSLASGADADAQAAAGELVVVRIAWSGGPWNAGVLTANDDANARPVAIGIARLEPVQGG